MHRPTVMVVVGALAFAGCGGGEDEQPSKDEFAKELTRACVKAKNDLRAIQRPDTPSELGGRFDQVRTALGDSKQRLLDLELPEGRDGELAQQYVDETVAAIDEQFLPAFRQLESASKSGDTRRIRRASRRLQAVDGGRTDDLARRLGAKACAGQR